MKSVSPQPCTFCGRQHSTPYSGGEWHATKGQTIACCPACATEVLPALIADSVHIYGSHYGSHYEKGRDALVRIEKSFWRAMTARASSAREAQ